MNIIPSCSFRRNQFDIKHRIIIDVWFLFLNFWKQVVCLVINIEIYPSPCRALACTHIQVRKLSYVVFAMSALVCSPILTCKARCVLNVYVFLYSNSYLWTELCFPALCTVTCNLTPALCYFLWLFHVSVSCWFTPAVLLHPPNWVGCKLLHS